jgi:glycine dehydrogenase subunit 1
MPYISNTEEQRDDMLKAIGVESYEELLVSIPSETRLKDMNLPTGMYEMEALEHLRNLASKNTVFPPGQMFAGAGVYNHYIPPIVSQLSTRSEFVTAYTPYQPEVSQGLLQTIFEYQTYICELTGLDISNASSYDGATACTDAVNIARSSTRRSKVVFSPNVHPHCRQVFETYNIGWKMETLELPYSNKDTFEIDVSKLDIMLANKDVACVVVAIPNFYGCFEKGLALLSDVCHKYGTLLAIGIYPFVVGFIKRPGELGADIAFGEGQPLGIPLNFGGPSLGFLAVKKDFVRFLPGRLIGKTTDENGKIAYVMTLQAREQHIRREKANSSICTNSALMALTATIFLSSVGKEGFKEIGRLSSGAAHALADMLKKISNIELAYPDVEFFNEFTIRINHIDAEDLYRRMISRGILPGVPLSNFNGDSRLWLIATTEQHKLEDLKKCASILSEEVSK